MNNNIKIPIIVKVSFGLVLMEAVLAVLYSLFSIIDSYGMCKWGLLAVFGSIVILLHVLLVWGAYRAVIKRKEKESMAIGIVLLALILFFLRLIFTVPGTATSIIVCAVLSAFFCFNGIVFIYWARQIKKVYKPGSMLEKKIGVIRKCKTKKLK